MSNYVQPYSQRIVAGTVASLSWQLIDGTGEPADPGTVTVNVSRADGTVLATSGVTSGTTTAARTYTLTAAQTATLDRLTVTWIASGTTLATTEVDVVAAPWFSNAELRAQEPSLAVTAAYSAESITTARLYVEAFFERVCHRRFVPGYDLRWVEGSASTSLVVPHPEVRKVRSAALYNDPAGTSVATLTLTELNAIPAAPSGVISRYATTWNTRWVKIGYEHGFTTPPPDVKRAAMRLTREILNEAKITSPDAAVSWNSSDLGWSAVFVTPGVRGAHTRLPQVNEVLDAWTFAEMGIA